jgi:hypothetical protein
MPNLVELVVLSGTICRIVWTLVGIFCLILIGRIFMAKLTFGVNITINPAAPKPLSAVSDPLNLTGTVGQPFSASLASNVQGGTPPYALSVAGTPPDGLTVDGNGNISGTPTTAGTSTLSVSVADSGA